MPFVPRTIPLTGEGRRADPVKGEVSCFHPTPEDSPEWGEEVVI